jgi:hypothetical protein
MVGGGTAAAAGPPPPARCLLAPLKLDQFESALHSEGYDFVSDLLDAEVEDLRALGEGAGMKKPQLKRFIKAVAAARQQVEEEQAVGRAGDRQGAQHGSSTSDSSSAPDSKRGPSPPATARVGVDGSNSSASADGEEADSSSSDDEEEEKEPCAEHTAGESEQALAGSDSDSDDDDDGSTSDTATSSDDDGQEELRQTEEEEQEEQGAERDDDPSSDPITRLESFEKSRGRKSLVLANTTGVSGCHTYIPTAVWPIANWLAGWLASGDMFA